MYNFITYPKTIDKYSYKYKFYDTKMKKITDCKIYSPFSHFKGNGFEFKRLIGPKKRIQSRLVFLIMIKKIKITFIHNFKVANYYANIIYRDRNNLLIKNSLTCKWYGTSPNLFLETTHYAAKTKTLFNVSNFFWDFYKVQKKITGYLMGTLSEWQKLVPKREGHLMRFIIRRTKGLRVDVGITRNILFLTPPKELRMAWPSNGILKNCHHKGKFVLIEADTK